MEEDSDLRSGCCDFFRLLFCFRGWCCGGVNCERPLQGERIVECRSDFVGNKAADEHVTDGVGECRSDFVCHNAADHVAYDVGADSLNTVVVGDLQESSHINVVDEVKEGVGVGFTGLTSTYISDRSGIEVADTPFLVQEALGLEISPSDWVGDVDDPTVSLFSIQDPWNFGEYSDFAPRPRNVVTTAMEPAFEQSKLYLLWGNPNANTQNNFEQARYAKEELIKEQVTSPAEGEATSIIHVPLIIKAEKTDFGSPLPDYLGNLKIIHSSELQELGELGSGTFGTVYHGKWRGSDVAIKRFNDVRGEDFWNEAINLAELRHTNVVAFYGVVLDGPGGSVAIVTEYMFDGSLKNALQNARNLNMRKRLWIAMDVAFGMEYLHSKNVVHFDLKSDNLLVDLRDPHRPVCKIGDLGLSKVRCTALISASLRGTYQWMAPELMNSSSSLVSEKVDIFSFGVVMWELITGEQPYSDLDYDTVVGGVLCNALRPPVPYYCDPGWRSLMERCWSYKPSERPSFSEIAHELHAMIA